jgi:hypothetical protein
MMMNHLKKLLYLVLVIGFGLVHAGAYEDFFKAVSLDDDRTVRELLSRGFDPNSTDPKGQTALYLGLREGSEKSCAVLMEHPQIRIDQANAVGETALMMAALKGRTDWVGRLLDRGARIDGANGGERPGWTALHYAASGPEAATVALLLERGARVDGRSPNGTTPLMMAAQYGPEDSVFLLLKKGADPRLKNDLGLTAVDFATRGGRESLAGRLQAAQR